MVFYVLRIKRNTRRDPGGDFLDCRWYRMFMREFAPGRFLWWDADPEVVEGDHGPPGPMPGWETCGGVPSTMFDSPADALVAWQRRPVDGIEPVVVRVSLQEV